MSAYGAISRPARASSETLPATQWSLPRIKQHVPTYVTAFHLKLETARGLPGLLPYLFSIFVREISHGRTYPQEFRPGETYTREMFERYFFEADVILGIISAVQPEEQTTMMPFDVAVEIAQSLGGREWEECVAGFYYVKPNYPGRSSHICNGGIIVPAIHRARGFGELLARSFLYYSPKLGYEAAVFNLMYANNQPSLRLWEMLGFTKVGLIPRAGRMRTEFGDCEEYVDAWVFYKSFVDAPACRAKL